MVATIDLLVIGGGSAGFAAAIRATELGFHTTLVEDDVLGGTCVNVGCVPSKTLLWAMANYRQAASHPFAGVSTAAHGLSWADVIAQKDALVAEMRQTKYVDVLDAYPQITPLRGRARFLDERRVAVDGRELRPGQVVIATGARPWAPLIAGLEAAGYLTSTTALALAALPDSLLVLGANAVGLELAQLFARAGVDVTLLELQPRIAPYEDEAISAALHDYLEAEGIHILADFATERVEKDGERYRLHGDRAGEMVMLEAAQLLVATGRRPNSDGLGLAAADVQVGPRGEIVVDETLRTNNPHIYAAGDVLGGDMYVYVAAHAGGLAAENALTGAGRVYDTHAIPRVTFTDPQIASTGLTEQQARAAGHDVQVSIMEMGQVPRALAAHDPRGLIKVVVDRSNGELLGAHILAPDAGEVIQPAVLALRLGLSVDQLRETMFPYLTSSEGLKLALLALEKDVRLLSCCAG